MRWIGFVKRHATVGVAVIFVVIILASAAAGVVLSVWLSKLQTIPLAKILNLAGIAYGLLGVLVLSEAIVRGQAVRRFMVQWTGSALLWAHTGLALGALVGAGIEYNAGRPSAHAAMKFASGLFCLVLWVGGFVDMTVTNPLSIRHGEISGRHQRLGLVVLVTGLALQLAAAVMDF